MASEDIEKLALIGGVALAAGAAVYFVVLNPQIANAATPPQVTPPIGSSSQPSNPSPPTNVTTNPTPPSTPPPATLNPKLILPSTVAPSSTSGNITVSVSGTGFAPNAHIQFGWSPIPPYTNVQLDTTSDGNGKWNGTFTAPWSVGSYPVVANSYNASNSQVTSTASGTLIVSTISAPIPPSSSTTSPPATTPPSTSTMPTSNVPTVPYTIVSGDSFYALGLKYGIDRNLIATLNPGVNPLLLQIGQVIQLPLTSTTSSLAQPTTGTVSSTPTSTPPNPGPLPPVSTAGSAATASLNPLIPTLTLVTTRTTGFNSVVNFASTAVATNMDLTPYNMNLWGFGAPQSVSTSSGQGVALPGNYIATNPPGYIAQPPTPPPTQPGVPTISMPASANGNNAIVGSGFSPNGQAIFYVTLNGQTSPIQTFTETADSMGNLNNVRYLPFWVSSQLTTHPWYAVDVTTGKKSNIVTA